MKNLNELNLKELSSIANEMGLTLSYKGEDGKRKRFNKSELIANIEYREFELNSEKGEEIKAEKIEASSVYGNNVSVKGEEIVSEKINLNSVVKEVKQLLSINDIEKVKSIISELQCMITLERKNKLLVRNMSSKLNIVKSLIKSHSIKQVF